MSLRGGRFDSRDLQRLSLRLPSGIEAKPHRAIAAAKKRTGNRFMALLKRLFRLWAGRREKNPIMASQIVLAPAPRRLQKMVQIYCTMVLPIR
jgi:hypothetical protein